MVDNIKDKFISLVVISGYFAIFLLIAYGFWGGNQFDAKIPGYILFLGYCIALLFIVVFILMEIPFAGFVKEAYSLVLQGPEGSALRNIFKASNVLIGFYCSVQSSVRIGEIFHVSWSSLPFTSVFLTAFLFAPFYIAWANIFYLATLFFRAESYIVKSALSLNGLRVKNPFLVVSVFLILLMCCWMSTVNSFGRGYLEEFAYNFDFQSHSCINIDKSSSVAYLSSSHSRILVRSGLDGNYAYTVHVCRPTN